jgi:hypothetical protein
VAGRCAPASSTAAQPSRPDCARGGTNARRGPRAVRARGDQEPGTYLLTDFLAAAFHRSVIVELGLDRYPDLRDDYFRHYSRVVWLTQRRTPLLEDAAERAAASIGLPLEVVDVGLVGLERALEPLVSVSGEAGA